MKIYVRIITYDSDNKLSNIYELPYKFNKNNCLNRLFNWALEESRKDAKKINGSVSLEWIEK